MHFSLCNSFGTLEPYQTNNIISEDQEVDGQIYLFLFHHDFSCSLQQEERSLIRTLFKKNTYRFWEEGLGETTKLPIETQLAYRPVWREKLL